MKDLDNTEINRFMNEISDKYPNFIYCGALPSDINPKFTIDNNFDYGYIFNTDKATKPGQHWLAVFVDNHPPIDHSKSVEYFDPTGNKPIKPIEKYLKKQFGNRGYKFKVNSVQQQGLFIKDKKKLVFNNACGAYSVNFLENRLKGESFQEATNYKPSDKYIMNLFDEIKR